MINENSSAEAKARYARFWGALPLTAEQRATQRPQRYSQGYQGLQAYSQVTTSKFLPHPGQSDMDYTRKLERVLPHLADQIPADEMAQVVEAYNGAVERLNGTQTHTELRQHLAGRQGVGTGVMGNSTPQQRAAALGSRWGGRDIRADGDLANRALQAPGQPVITSASQINQIMAQREAERTGPPVQHADVRQLRSTGTGWMAR